MIPSHEELFRRVRVLTALDERIAEGDPIGRVYHPADDGAEARYDDGAGNTALILRNEAGLLVRAFDHESSASRHMREDGLPDPALTEGLPPALEPLLKRVVAGLEPEDRTFVAWDVGEGWVMRGDPEPAEPLWRDAADARAWLEDEGWEVAEADLRALFSGKGTVAALDLGRVVAPTIAGPAGWAPGQPFRLRVRGAGPAGTLATLKAVREATGESLGALKKALNAGDPVFDGPVAAFAFGPVKMAAAVARALEGETEPVFEVSVGDGAPQAVSREVLKQMLGAGGMFLR